MTKILVIDDDPDVTFLVEEMLSREGFEVIGANSGSEGIEKVGIEDPDLILVDVMMPEMDGWETSKLIKEDPASKDKMIVMFTTKAEDVERIKSQRPLIADWYISKPIQRDTFVKTVNWLLTSPFEK